MTDETHIHFGRHKGKRLIDVPADYLIWLYENNKCYGPLRKYIEDNREALNNQVLTIKKQKKNETRG